MYDLSSYKEADRQVLLEFLARHPFAFLTGSFADGRPVATQVPMLIEEREGKLVLNAHIMRHTDHHRAFLENPQVLAVFTGPSAYVSATWYTDPRGGSTWNYMSVHLRGSIRFLDEDGLRDSLRRLTLHFEGQDHRSPTVYDNLPERYVQRMLPAIAAFEIEVEGMEHVFKLSQDRDRESYLRIIERLEERGGDSARIAEEMKARTEQLFPSGKQ